MRERTQRGGPSSTLSSRRHSAGVLCQAYGAVKLVRRVSVIVTAVLALPVASAVARVAPRDAAITHAYLQLEIAEQHAIRGAYSATLKALGKLAAEARAGCPGILAGAPLRKEDAQANQSARDISEELFSVVLGTGERVEHPLLARFARKVKRLRWSSPRLTRLVHSYAIEQAEHLVSPLQTYAPI